MGVLAAGGFNSTGTREEQQANLALVTRLMGEMGQDGERMASSDDRLFLQDVRVKMNQSGASTQFGWRQVERMVQVHTQVMVVKKMQEDRRAHGKRDGASGSGASPEKH